MDWEWIVPIFRYGKRWRLHRQICQQNFRAAAVRGYHPLLERKARELCKQFLLDPQNFSQHNKLYVLSTDHGYIPVLRSHLRTSISIPMAAMYGYEVNSLEDPCIAAAEEGLLLGSALLFPGATWINVFPILARLPIPTWLPGASTWRICERVKELAKVAERIPYEFVKKGIVGRERRSDNNMI